MLLWLRIDEHGQVVDVSAGEPGVPGGWVEAARASLAAVPFTPARKDERAVKSRIQVSLSFLPNRQERRLRHDSEHSETPSPFCRKRIRVYLNESIL